MELPFLERSFFSFLCVNSLPDETVPDLMYFKSQAAEQYTDDAQMHHFLDTNLYRAKPKVSGFFLVKYD